MSATISNLEELISQAQKLSLVDRVKLIERLAATVQQELNKTQPVQPKQSALGLLADLGPGPSAEDIDEVRREMLANFP